MNNILVVDDDTYIRELVTTLLKNEGFHTLEAANGRDALTQLSKDKLSLCILDIMMPGMDGFEALEHIRRYHDLPVLMLTAKGETSQKVRGFQLGADDYLTKPFEPAELIARVRALLKRYQIAYAQSAEVGRLIIDKASHTVSIGGEDIPLPLKEFDLLFTLCSYPGKTLTRDRLIEEVWGYDFEGNERTLDVHINRLRERFDAETSGIRIATVRGLGYRLEVL